MSKFYLKCCSLSLVMLLSITTIFAQQAVTGRVTDANGALTGVTVSVIGTTRGTQTDANGAYSIQASEGETLRFSMIGYASQDITVGSNKTIHVVLEGDAGDIGEVVVTAMGISREAKALGYAATTISSKELTEAGNTNLGSALYGKATGVNVTTAPGGASSAVNVQIRGINSLNYNRQPLYVVDGVMIRNDQQYGPGGANNGGGISDPGFNAMWSDNRIRGNGMLDINPNDVESLTILKGASATAIYGSDAASGVIVITTKKGSASRGLGVDFNYNTTFERAAFLPKLQYVYGPGYDEETNIAAGANAEGWIQDGRFPGERILNYNAWGQFGPKFDGGDVRWWDGSVRSYSAQKNNYADVFDNGHNHNFNVSLSNQTERLNYRLSGNHMDYKSTTPGSKQKRSTFNLNSTVKLADNLSLDVIGNYMNTATFNRPFLMGDVLASYGGFFNGAEDMNRMKELYQNSEGFKYSTRGTNRPEEFAFAVRPANLLNYFWNQYRNGYQENENRFLSSATLNWSIIDKLKFRARLGNDVTSLNIENREHNEYATIYNGSNSTGQYQTSKGLYSILYGDALLTYADKIGADFDFSISGGFQSREEKYKDQMSRTEGGLVTENWFSLSNTFAQAITTDVRKSMMKYAYIGLANISYRNYLFLEAAGRSEVSSTLPIQNNTYNYWSANTSFVFSDAFELPQSINYGKLRASYGIVGNDAPIYGSNIAYQQNSLQTINGPVPALGLTNSYGNPNLKPERKYETEFGVEMRFLDSRLGFDVSYYSNRIEDQILALTTAPSAGARNQLVNVGEISNQGWEASLTGNPVRTENFRWNVRLNFSTNRSKLETLTAGVPELVFYEGDQSSVRLVARPGERLGNIYVYPRATDADGNLLISDEGNYIMDKTRYENVGNIMPKAIGGLSNSFNYKDFSLDFTADYRFGGQMISLPHKYAYGAGRLESTLEYREEGVVLEGVNVNTGQPNTVRLSGAEYYMNNHYWGNDAWNEKSAVLDNDFIKLRELSFGYRLPQSVTNKLKVNNLRISVIGRNLFYIYRTIKDIDPEAPVGNHWYSQGVDIGSTAATRSFGFSLNANF